MNDQALTKLVVGAGSPLLGWTVSHQIINEYLQTVSLILGIIVGVVTLFTMLVRIKK
jgi:hypothetical protein